MKASELIALLQLMIERYGDHPVNAFDTAYSVLENVCNVAYTVIPQGYGWFEIYTQRPEATRQMMTAAPAPVAGHGMRELHGRVE